MAWEHLSINRPHLAYAIIGGFTSLFMLVSLFVKEKLYIGEATVATICGIIFGPHGAGLFNPNSWGNVDQITLECSRIVLVVQCFAVGVELPKQYMTRHWKSVVMLLLPVMAYGWLICSVFIWWMIPKLSWLDSLCVAACITATDPVLASSVVGKGKFAKRIPKHLRDLLSAESGCNDGMAFPFIYLSLYLIAYRPNAGKVFSKWFLYTILYECIFGAILGIVIGYGGRHAIKFAEKKSLIDRESFLSFYFVLALFCAGVGSMLGTDDLLVGFCAGVAFSNDGWFAQRTEESHVSNVIDLLLNLAYFVYFGSIIPWSSYNRPEWDLTPWRLIVLAIFVIFFRRIPIMVCLKPLIPDIKTWRESLFAGHFGPIGVGAIFVAILARAELETGETTPLAKLPPPGTVNYLLIELIWPIVTFLVVTSIIVHGSSIAVFTLGKHVNTMRLTMSFTTGNDDATWFNRLPGLGSRTPSMSFRKADASESSNEKINEGGLFAGGLLSRASTRGRDENGRISSEVPRRRYDGTGRPVGGIGLLASQTPRARSSSPAATRAVEQDRIETYREGRNLIFEDEQGDVISRTKTPPRTEEHHIGSLDASAVAEKLQNPIRRRTDDSDTVLEDPTKHKAAMAFRFDDNIIVEDEDGEVIKRYKIPKVKRRPTGDIEIGESPTGGKGSFFKNLFGFGAKDNADDDNDLGMITDEEGDVNLEGKRIRLRDAKGRKLSKQQFIHELSMMDPHARRAMVSQSSFFPVEEGITGPSRREKLVEVKDGLGKVVGGRSAHTQESSAQITNTEGQDQNVTGLALVDSEERIVPYHDLPGSKASKFLHSPEGARTAAAQGTTIVMAQGEETAAERRRRDAALGISGEETLAERRRREAALGLANEDSEDSDDDGAPRIIGQPKQRKTREIKFAAQESGQRQRDTPGPESGSNNGNEIEAESGGIDSDEETGASTLTPSRVIQFAEDTKGKQRQL
ncbi:Sodium/hydrogen exchanger family-domain-containing protein [Tirmania nivea]|nr:Sodium/hydrogen exchanger family-domain-containing protein [Tirmania nivea]